MPTPLDQPRRSSRAVCRRGADGAAAVLVLTLCACGSLGGDGGGGENLPNRGIVPYERVDARTEDSERDPTPDDALVLVDGEDVGFRAPSAVSTGDGCVDLYVAVEEPDDHWVGVARSCGGTTIAEIDRVVDASHTAALDVSDGRVGAPSVAVDNGERRLAVAVGDGEAIAVGTLTSRDHAGPLTIALRASDVPSAGSIGSPSLLLDHEGRWRMYFAFIMSATDSEPARGAIGLATSADGSSFSFETVVLLPGADCTDASGDAQTCWDQAWVAGAEVRLARTALDRPIYRMWYAGHRAAPNGVPEQGDIGFAASFDGQEFSRFAYSPVIDSTQLDEGAPSNAMVGSAYWLYFEQRPRGSGRRGRSGIAMAINDRPEPSEQF